MCAVKVPAIAHKGGAVGTLQEPRTRTQLRYHALAMVLVLCLEPRITVHGGSGMMHVQHRSDLQPLHYYSYYDNYYYDYYYYYYYYYY